MYRIPDKIIEAGRNLRKNMTESEKILWKELKNSKLGVKFLRQNPMYVYTENNGLDRFIIPDFYCKKLNLIVELDGSVHNLKEVLILDLEKEKLLKSKGINILRFTNEEIINNLDLVISKIKEYI